jgi:hypothetical protein
MIKLSRAAACFAAAMAGPALAQNAQPADAVPTAPSPLEPDAAAPVTLTVIPEEVVRGETAPVITVPGIAVGTVRLEAGPGSGDSVSVGAALDAAIKSGVLGQILSGQPYTIFVPSNGALDTVPQDVLADVFDDPDRIAEVIRGYIVEGHVDTDAAFAMAREAGSQITIESISGAPIVIAAEGENLSINGAQVVVPNLGYASLVAHIIDGAFLPGEPAR